MKKLFLIRHAKAEQQTAELSDRERALTEEGQAQAKALATELKNQQVKPDKIICSVAVRAEETAHILAKGMGFSENKIIADKRLYEESIELLVDVMKEVPDTIQTLVIVAHNPTLSWFATYLNNNERVDLSPCGVFAMQFEMNAWIEMSQVDGELIFINAINS